MDKPDFQVYENYEKECAERGQDQHLVKDFLVGHPRTTRKGEVILFEKLLGRYRHYGLHGIRDSGFNAPPLHVLLDLNPPLEAIGSGRCPVPHGGMPKPASG